jgi:hypothetical protein
MYVPYILQNAILLVQQINNINKNLNITKCSMKQTFLNSLEERVALCWL